MNPRIGITAALLAACLGLPACDRSMDMSSDASRVGGQAVATVPDTAAVSADAKANAPSAEPTASSALENLLKPDDTLDSAKARLGENNVAVRELSGIEGETFQGWILYPDDPMREIEVIPDEAGKHPIALRISAPNSAWKRADGVRIGTTTAELQAMNGKPFKFYGFDWDYGGAITDWNGGAMASGKTPRGGLSLCPPEQTDEPIADYPSGDQEFSSDDPRLVPHPAVVCEFTVNL